MSYTGAAGRCFCLGRNPGVRREAGQVVIVRGADDAAVDWDHETAVNEENRANTTTLTVNPGPECAGAPQLHLHAVD